MEFAARGVGHESCRLIEDCGGFCAAVHGYVCSRGMCLPGQLLLCIKVGLLRLFQNPGV